MAFCFVDSGSGIGMKPGSLAIRFRSDSILRMVGTIAHLLGCELSGTMTHRDAYNLARMSGMLDLSRDEKAKHFLPR